MLGLPGRDRGGAAGLQYNRDRGRAIIIREVWKLGARDDGRDRRWPRVNAAGGGGGAFRHVNHT